MKRIYTKFKRFLFLVAVIVTSHATETSAQYDVYANQLISNSSDVNNPLRIVDADQTNYADINTLIGVLATSDVRVRFSEYGAAGDVVNFTIQTSSSLLSTSVLSGVTIKLYDSAGSTPVATASGSSVLQLTLLGLLSSGNAIYNLKFVTNPGGTYKFKDAKLELSSVLGVGLLSEVRLYGSYFQRPCPAVYANAATGGSLGLSLLGYVDSVSNLTDANANNSARMYTTLDLLGLGGTFLNATFPRYGKAGDFVGFTVANPSAGILDLGLLDGLTLITYDESGSVKETRNGSSLLNLKLLSGSSDRYTVGFQTTPGTYRISKVRLVKNGVASVLNNLRVFNAFYYTINRPPVTVSTSGPVKFCAGGSVVLTAFDSLGATNYVWSTGATTASITVNTAGTYYVSVTDSFDCERRSIPIKIDITPKPTPTIAGDSVLCSGTGTLNLNGKTYPYQLWSTGSAAATISNVKAGKYYVTVTDSNGCQGADTIVVVNNRLNIVPTITPTTCSNSANGAISLTVTNGSGNYSYRWSTGSTASSITGQKEGLYTCIVKDNIYGCSFNKSFSLTASNTLTIKTSVVNTSACGKTDGTVNLNVIGGSGTYTYSWSNGATTSGLSAVGAGIYKVLVTDAGSGCTKSDTVAIGDGGNTLVVTPTVSNATSCSTPNGSASVAVSGGSGSYTYTWSNGGTSSAISGLSAGNYYVVVKDGSTNCSKAIMVTVNNNGALTLNTTIVKSGCNKQNGSVAVTVSGGSGNYSFLWSTGATTATISNLGAATYIVNVTDITSGCLKQEYFTVTDSSGPAATLAITQPDCATNANGAITVTASGTNNVYNWSNGFTSKDISGLKPGTYTLTIYDSVTFCTAVYQAVLSVKNPIRLVASPSSNTGCATALNGGVTVTVSGGLAPFTYSWSSGDNTKDITGKDAGTYSLTVTDANGCNNNIAAKIITDSAKLLNATVGTITQATCNTAKNGGVTVNVSGGKAPYTYLWTPGGVTTKDLTAVLAGTYNLTVTDNAGCTKTLSVDITSDTSKAIKITANTIKDAACSGNATGAISVSVTGGVSPYTYLWSNGATTKDITGLVPGAYTLTAKDAAGCTQNFTATIKVDTANLIKLSTNSIIAAKCTGSNSGSIGITIMGGLAPFTYLWSNGAATKDIASIPSGTYSLLVTDANGCTATISVVVGVDNTNPIKPVLDSVKSVGCLNTASGAIYTSVTGGVSPYTYSWSNGAVTQDIIGITTGAYTLTVKDAAGCQENLTATVTNAPLLVVNAVSNNAKCFGNANGNISLTVTNGSGNYSFIWTDGKTITNRDSLSAGTYSVKVTDNISGCFVNKSFAITQPDSLKISGIVIKDSCMPGFDGSITVSVNGGTSPYTFAWENGGSGDFIQGLSANNYTVKVTDANGCTVSESYTVTTANCDFTINIHDVITPNGDGINDAMVIEGIEFYPKSMLQVVDKWGDLVYEKRGYDNSFRGLNSKSGDVLPSGTYYYVLRLNDENILGGENTFKGALLIKR